MSFLYLSLVLQASWKARDLFDRSQAGSVACRSEILSSIVYPSHHVGAFLLLRCAPVVPAGQVGVVDVLGKVRGEALPSGLHLVNPFATLHRMSVQTQEVKEALDTPSSEGLTVHLDVSVQSHLDPAKAADVYRTIGLEYETVLVKPNVRSAVCEVTSSYEAKAL